MGESFASISWNEGLIILYTFILSVPIVLLLEFLFYNDFLYIRITKHTKKHKKALCKLITGYTIVVLWLTWCFMGIVLISIFLESQFNSTQMWISSYLLTILLELLIWQHIKAIFKAILYRYLERRRV
jgi:hypothetical protein